MNHRVLAGLVLAVFAAPLAAADLERAADLIKRGQAASAYALLAPEADAQAGDARFDYLFGVAAVDSGRPDEAVGALERLLALNPNHHGARMELARAYYALGADDLARREFDQLSRFNPPPQARGAIEQYLRAIETRKQRATRPSLTGWAETGAGYDDNLTAVTDDFTTATAQTYYTPLNPTGNSVLRESAFLSLGGGLSYKHPQGSRLYDFDLGAQFKGYSSYGDYNTLSAFASGGTSWRRQKHVLRLGVSALSSRQQTEQVSLTDEAVSNDRTLLGLSGQWRYDLTRSGQASVQLQHHLIRYADVEVNNIDQTVLTLGWAQMLGERGLVIANVFAGHDAAINPLPSGRDYTRDNLGLRLTGQWQAAPKIGLYAAAGVARRRDADAATRARPELGRGRDHSMDFTVGASWQATGHWSLRGQYTLTRNDSNFDLYDFRRQEASLLLRRDFR